MIPDADKLMLLLLLTMMKGNPPDNDSWLPNHMCARHLAMTHR